jgi:arginine exporter protein ArgO
MRYRQRNREIHMKLFALIAGALFLLIGIAGFAGLLAMVTMYGAVIAAAGAILIMYGVTRRRETVPARGPGHDMRDLGGV